MITICAEEIPRQTKRRDDFIMNNSGEKITSIEQSDEIEITDSQAGPFSQNKQTSAN